MRPVIRSMYHPSMLARKTVSVPTMSYQSGNVRTNKLSRPKTSLTAQNVITFENLSVGDMRAVRYAAKSVAKEPSVSETICKDVPLSVGPKRNSVSNGPTKNPNANPTTTPITTAFACILNGINYFLSGSPDRSFTDFAIALCRTTNEQIIQTMPKSTLMAPPVKNDTASESSAIATRRIVDWRLKNVAILSEIVSALSSSRIILFSEKKPYRRQLRFGPVELQLEQC